MKPPASRRRLEALLRLIYFGDWPAKLWGLLPAAGRIEEVRATLAILPPGCRPLRLGFVSDLHLGPTTSLKTLHAALRVIDRERPDVLLLGGDYVALDATERNLRLLSELVSHAGAEHKLGVLGNHDLWTDPERITDVLRESGVTVLANEAVPLPGTEGRVIITGIDDPIGGEPRPVPVESEATVITLCHSPDGLLLTQPSCRLFLCGHTHGGHIASPRGPIVLPEGELCVHYHSGFYDHGDIRVFVSRGVGGADVPFRLFAPPDVAVFNLVPEDHGESR